MKFVHSPICNPRGEEEVTQVLNSVHKHNQHQQKKHQEKYQEKH